MFATGMLLLVLSWLADQLDHWRRPWPVQRWARRVRESLAACGFGLLLLSVAAFAWRVMP